MEGTGKQKHLSIISHQSFFFGISPFGRCWEAEAPANHPHQFFLGYPHLEGTGKQKATVNYTPSTLPFGHIPIWKALGSRSTCQSPPSAPYSVTTIPYPPWKPKKEIHGFYVRDGSHQFTVTKCPPASHQLSVTNVPTPMGFTQKLVTTAA